MDVSVSKCFQNVSGSSPLSADVMTAILSFRASLSRGGYFAPPDSGESGNPGFVAGFYESRDRSLQC
jgi:hypothetical protein